MGTQGNGKSSISNRLCETHLTILKGLENFQLRNLWCVWHRVSSESQCLYAWVTSSVPRPRPPRLLWTQPLESSGSSLVSLFSCAFYSSQQDSLFRRQRGLLPPAFVISAASNVSGLTCSGTHGASFSWSRVSAELSSNTIVQTGPLFFPADFLTV